MPNIGKTNFNAKFFDAYIRNIFCESLSFSSLAFEKEFTSCKEADVKLTEFANEKNSQYALKLDKGNEDDKKLLIKRFEEISYYLNYKGIPKVKEYNDDIEDYTPCIEDFKVYYSGAIRPYRNERELNEARDKNLLTGEAYEQETLIDKVGVLYSLIYKKINADYKARLLKKGNNDAFLYSLTLDNVNLKDIIDINSILNKAVGISGLRKINNSIQKCPFKTTSKEFVRFKLEELLYKYNNEWAESIPEIDLDTATEDELTRYQIAICNREANFHIEFEHIHPFEDGNGRTGRIILCRNLIANNMAPIIITPQMRNTYIGFINEEDYEGLGNFIYMLSSLQLTNMTSEYRKAKGIKPDVVSFTKTPNIKLNV